METVYFLVFVGICAAAVRWYVVRSLRQPDRNDRKARHKSTYYVHRGAHNPVLHTHARSLKPAGVDMWVEHRRHAFGEKHRSESLTASKLQFDTEIDERQSDQLKMKEFTYTPTEFFESTGRKR